MRPAVTASLGLLFGVLAACGDGGPSSSSAAPTEATSTDGAFTADIPDGWSDAEGSPLARQLQTVYLAMRTDDPRTPGTLGVLSEAQPAGSDVATLAAHEVANLPQRITGASGIGSWPMSVDGASAYAVSYGADVQGQYRELEILTIHAGRLYTITLVASPGRYLADAQAARDAVVSWRWR